MKHPMQSGMSLSTGRRTSANLGHPQNGLNAVHPSFQIPARFSQRCGNPVQVRFTCFAARPVGGLGAQIHLMMAVHGPLFDAYQFHITIAAWMSVPSRMAVWSCVAIPSHVEHGQTAPQSASLFPRTTEKPLQRSVTLKRNRNPSSAILRLRQVDQTRSPRFTHGSVDELSGRMSRLTNH